ncbi:hypothetical protein FHT08_003712 [Xanthomonas campestris]|uniref:TniQ family protein n=1 Tax=Xanthomonas sp. CFBP 8151 TaxID=3035310 RepID=UPI001FB87711|nr:TniQ family protein [Xanthomonas sp. CFBP 8151]NIJ78578.1 hypothetical protein [Xanthomonas sp. CFBP 8151]
MHWPLPLEPHEDELLSSFLVRSAHRHGLSPYRFCAFHFPGAAVWNRDIDRSASDALLAAIAVKAGITPARVMQMTLRSLEGSLGKDLARGSAPWINRVGIYHRLRRRWGLQYCPDCLAERPILCRAWRMSCMVACSRHRRLLQDACPHCDAPLAIHRQLLSSQLCHHCSRVLGRTPDELNVSIDPVLRAQSYFKCVLHSGTAEIGGRSVCSDDLFHGARVLASLLAPAWLPQDPAEHCRPSLEQARVQARAGVVLRVVQLLALWPFGFRQLASVQHLTQRSFARRSLPDWLKSAVDELPAGRTRHALPRQHHSLRAKLEQDRRRNVDWRSARAALLWQAASK